MIYFIQEHNNPNGLIKIGRTSNLEERLKTLQIGSPVPLKVLKVIPGTQLRDGEIHRKFKNERVYGEWFYPSPALLKFINECGTGWDGKLPNTMRCPVCGKNPRYPWQRACVVCWKGK